MPSPDLISDYPTIRISVPQTPSPDTPIIRLTNTQSSQPDLMVPRIESPSFFQDLPRANAHSLWQSYDPSFVAPVEPEEYTTLGGHWGTSSTVGTPGGTVTWSIVGAGWGNSTPSAFFTGSTVSLGTVFADFQNQIAAAFAAWSAVANIQFQFVADGGGNMGVGTSAHIRIGAGYIDGNSGSNVLARAYGPPNGTAGASAYHGDIVVDSSNTWNTSLFYTTILHEIGHALGLGHSSTGTVVMNPTITPGLTLQSDDIAGIRYLYGTAPSGPADDYAGNSSTTGTVAVGGQRTGNIETNGDTDWFRVNLVAGRTYILRVDGADGNAGTISDPFMTLYNGSSVFLTENDDGGQGFGSTIYFTATTTGSHYIAARGFGSATGTYTVTVNEVLPFRSFYSDNSSDVIFRNSNGSVATWNIVNGVQTGATFTGHATGDWQMTRIVSDFDGDGRVDDILWRNTNTGTFVIWNLTNGVQTGSSFVGQASLDWQTVTGGGVGNFDNDSIGDDFVLRNMNTGAVVVWTLTNGQQTGSHYLGSATLDWQIVGMGDFDGDGRRDDILWRNSNSGAVVTWTTANGQQEFQFNIGGAPVEWQIFSTGDFDGDGRNDDILFRNSNTGVMVAWLTEGGAQTGQTVIGHTTFEWTLSNIGDYDGDGRNDDLLFRNVNTGGVVVWTTTNGVQTGGSGVGGITPDWFIQ
jgi:hypothetical protein